MVKTFHCFLGWQKLAGFRRTQLMPSFLSSGPFLLIRVVFAHICKYMGPFYLIFLNAGQKEAALHLKLNKSFITRKSQQILISRQNSVCKELKCVSESKLFGKGCLHVRATPATLTCVSFKRVAKLCLIASVQLLG